LTFLWKTCGQKKPDHSFTTGTWKSIKTLFHNHLDNSPLLYELPTLPQGPTTTGYINLEKKKKKGGDASQQTKGVYSSWNVRSTFHEIGFLLHTLTLMIFGLDKLDRFKQTHDDMAGLFMKF